MSQNKENEPSHQITIRKEQAKTSDMKGNNGQGWWGVECSQSRERCSDIQRRQMEKEENGKKAILNYFNYFFLESFKCV